MAFVAFTAAFDIDNLDFHAAYGPGHVAVPIDHQAISIPAQHFVFLDSEINIPEQVIDIPETTLVRAVGGAILAIGGTGLEATAAGYPSAGTANYLAMGNGGVSFQALGIGMDGRAFAAAARSVGTADDRLLFQNMLSGNDMILLSAGSDRIDTGGGRDFVTDIGGNDTIATGAGNDIVQSATGDDVLDGAGGNDLLMDLAGKDELNGGAGRDILWAFDGGDTLSGGPGADVFLFVAAQGASVVRDFADGVDRLLIYPPGLEFDDLVITQVGTSARVKFGGTTVTLQHVDAGALTAADFIFGKLGVVNHAVADFFDGWNYTA